MHRKVHELAKKYYEHNNSNAQEELKKIEEEIDKTVAKLYGITNEELEEIKKTLKILKEGEEPEEEETALTLPKLKDVINSLMERFKKIFVISHIEDVKDAFETKLIVENIDGYSKIRFE